LKRNLLLPGLALLGFAIALAIVIYASLPVRKSPPSAQQVVAPFDSYVAGVGIAEAGRGNVAVGTAMSGVVAGLDVRVGDRVRAGDPLFRIDDRDLRAKLAVAQARAAEADSALAKPRHRLEFLSRLQSRDRGAVSAQLLSDARDDVRAAESALVLARAEVSQIQTDIDRSQVRAPSPGRVLQVNTRVGEFVEGGGQSAPPLLLGDDSRVFLRVDIDESDAWRIRPEASARAYVRGNRNLAAVLRFEYLEPYVAPKVSMTGQSTERADVRVLQVVYSFERGRLPVYLGQQMDVFIAAPPWPSPADARAP
jgi:multidrug efflux pump subunit AcrA (membrane-fusion protein)